MKLAPGGREATRNTVKNEVPSASKPALPPFGGTMLTHICPCGHPAGSSSPWLSVDTYLVRRQRTTTG